MSVGDFSRSREAMAGAGRYLAGGVNSNFRAGISPTPLVFTRGEGPYLFDIDGNRLIDFYMAMGPIMLGHDAAPVLAAVERQLRNGILFAGQTEIEFEAARLFCELVPCAERVRFGSSGSEVVQAALRLARAATGRSAVIRFEGHYHGWFDNILWSFVPSAEQCGPPDHPARVAGSPGQDELAGAHTEVMVWNDPTPVVERLERGDVAAVIMEPVMCNTGAIRPQAGYLEAVREACDRTGTILIFDEVITGFRLAAGGAQQVLGVTPDLAVFGKAIANGFPVAAVAGRADIVDLFQTRKVAHGGTYNGHPVSMAATVATLSELAKGEVYALIERRGQRLMDGIAQLLRDYQVIGRVQGFPAIFHVAFGTSEPLTSYRDTFKTDKVRYVRFTTAMVERGVRALERGAWFLCAAHDDAVIEQTLSVVEDSLRAIRV
jgi:glutamate-1-semialdehyde 2,1-aminomutase